MFPLTTKAEVTETVRTCARLSSRRLRLLRRHVQPAPPMLRRLRRPCEHDGRSRHTQLCACVRHPCRAADPRDPPNNLDVIPSAAHCLRAASAGPDLVTSGAIGNEAMNTLGDNRKHCYTLSEIIPAHPHTAARDGRSASTKAMRYKKTFETVKQSSEFLQML